MRIKITTQADADLQKLFLAAAGVHGKTFADALDLGMRSLLRDIDPGSVLDTEISACAERLAEMQRKRAELRVIEPLQKRIQQFTPDPEADEAARLAQWEKEKTTLPRNLRRGDVNWSRVLWDYRFSSRREATAWFRIRIAQEGKNE